MLRKAISWKRRKAETKRREDQSKKLKETDWLSKIKKKKRRDSKRQKDYRR